MCIGPKNEHFCRLYIEPFEAFLKVSSNNKIISGRIRNLSDNMADKMEKKGKSKDQRNANERARSHEITNAFSNLKNQVRHLDAPFQSQIEILNLAIKRIKDLNSILKEDKSDMSVDMHFSDNPTIMQISGDESNEMSSNNDHLHQSVNMEFIKEDSDRMYDMASYALHSTISRQEQSDVDCFEWELNL